MPDRARLMCGLPLEDSWHCDAINGTHCASIQLGMVRQKKASVRTAKYAAGKTGGGNRLKLHILHNRLAAFSVVTSWRQTTCSYIPASEKMLSPCMHRDNWRSSDGNPCGAYFTSARDCSDGELQMKRAIRGGNSRQAANLRKLFLRPVLWRIQIQHSQVSSCEIISDHPLVRACAVKSGTTQEAE